MDHFTDISWFYPFIYISWECIDFFFHLLAFLNISFSHVHFRVLFLFFHSPTFTDQVYMESDIHENMKLIAEWCNLCVPHLAGRLAPNSKAVPLSQHGVRCPFFLQLGTSEYDESEVWAWLSYERQSTMNSTTSMPISNTKDKKRRFLRFLLSLKHIGKSHPTNSWPRTHAVPMIPSSRQCYS